MCVSSTSGDFMGEPFQEIIDIFRCDAETSRGTPAKDFAKFLNDQDWVSAVKYLGFSTDSIMSQLVKNRASYLARVPDEVVYEIRQNSWKRYSNLGPFKLDMMVLVIGGLTQNCNINKLIEKANGPCKEFLIMLKEKYVIRDLRTSLDPSVITLPKIVRALPVMCGYLFHKMVTKEIVPYDTFPGTTKPATHAICYPLLQSCCPFTLKGINNFHPVMLWVQIKLDDIIHRWDGNKTSLSQILSYYMAAYQSRAMTAANRITFFLNVGLIETSSGQNIRLTQTAALLADNCLSELDNMRRDDEKHATLMRLASTGEF